MKKHLNGDDAQKEKDRLTHSFAIAKIIGSCSQVERTLRLTPEIDIAVKMHALVSSTENECRSGRNGRNHQAASSLAPSANSNQCCGAFDLFLNGNNDAMCSRLGREKVVKVKEDSGLAHETMT